MPKRLTSTFRFNSGIVLFTINKFKRLKASIRQLIIYTCWSPIPRFYPHLKYFENLSAGFVARPRLNYNTGGLGWLSLFEILRATVSAGSSISNLGPLSKA